ncbi:MULTISPECIES: hypothetical protein [Saccharothrix]|uniref:hypothetical protein n=1 Tax=Saccharothrix TaxID=2071 RepID=UPI00093BBBD3|nr:hypothetical protein [Saccharothrix sp. CB00851]OKI17781.1 hypothetical protein A6A25_40200 [Saccharothrix sp. CB00851]
MTDLFTIDPPKNSDLPVPPLRLRRVKLMGVGPDRARFDPLDLDFTTRDGAASRVLLSLTNTGGKSTLITLLCSLVVPAAREQVGGKILGDYVLTGDTSHIVCEWEDAQSGTRTVTGAVMEWKDGRRQPGHKMRSTTNMHRLWYLFRTGTGLPGIDDLPFITAGKRTTYKDFRGAVGDLIASHPKARGLLVDKQKEWTRALEDNTSVDPTLFGYQMRMNDSETGAESLLSSFNSPDNVVRFFVAALNDERDLEAFTGKLEAYAHLASTRPSLELLTGFGAAIVPRIELVAQRSERAAEAAAKARKVLFEGGELASALEMRIEQDQRDLVGLEEAAVSAAQEANKARYEYRQISDIRLQLQLEEARARVATAQEAVVLAKTAAAERTAEFEAWAAVDAVLELQIARARLDEAQAAYDAAEAGLAPLRERRVTAAANLAGRLDALIDEMLQTAATADQLVADTEQDERDAQEAHTKALMDGREVARQLEAIADLVDEADQARASAVNEGWLTNSERPDACVRRWRETSQAATVNAEEARQRAQDAEQAFDRFSNDINTVDTELIALRRAAEQHGKTLADHDRDLSAAAADETVRELIGGDPEDVAPLARVVELATNLAHQADARAAEKQSEARSAQEELNHLTDTGIASAGLDVLVVLDILNRSGIGAVTGLNWIERNITDPGHREPFISRHPELAGGVIVTDPSRFTEAVGELTHGSPRTRTPVVVSTAPAATTLAVVDDVTHHVVVPHRATWDREWAREVKAELEHTVAESAEAAAQAHRTARRYRDTAAMCGNIVQRWKGYSREDLVRAEQEASGRLREAEGRREELTTQQKSARETAAGARQEHQAELRNAVVADKHAAAAERLADLVEKAEFQAARRPGLEASRARAARDLDAAAERVRKARAVIGAAMRRAAQSRSAAEAHGRERGELGVDHAAADPGGNLEVLRATWTAARDELALAEAGMAEAGALQRAEAELGRARQRTTKYGAATLSRAEHLSWSGEAASPLLLAAAQQRARQAAEDAEKSRLNAEVESERAQKDLIDAQPTAGGHQNYVDLRDTSWAPESPADIPRLLEKLETRNLELKERRDQADAVESEANELVAAVRSDVEALSDTSRLWVGDRVPATQPFAGSKQAARTRMLSLVEERQKADGLERAEREKLNTAISEAKTIAASKEWNDLESPVLVRVQSLPDTDLAAEAPVLAQRIRSMTESAAADLRELDEHRSILRDGLLSLCRDQRRLLREVSKSSKLPAGLGVDLSDAPAIKIRFDEAPDDEAAARLAKRVDSWSLELATNPKKAKSSEVRARWLADAVRDTVVDRSRAGAWSIEILKPRIDGKSEYCPPDRIPHEFSGGQVLTLAVLVYCALSQVRSAHRSGGSRPAGTLILDNPFGAASAETLIAMQHRLAAHTGVQLVCATGLHDPAVDEAFTGNGSVIVKLRNDGDLRRNLSFLRLRASVVDGVDVPGAITGGRDPSSPQNWVTTTRYEVR